MNFVINLMRGYNKNDFFDKKTLKRKIILCKDQALSKAKEIPYNCKKNPRRGIKSLFPKNFKKDIYKGQKMLY